MLKTNVNGYPDFSFYSTTDMVSYLFLTLQTFGAYAPGFLYHPANPLYYMKWAILLSSSAFVILANSLIFLFLKSLSDASTILLLDPVRSIASIILCWYSYTWSFNISPFVKNSSNHVTLISDWSVCNASISPAVDGVQTSHIGFPLYPVSW